MRGSWCYQLRIAVGRAFDWSLRGPRQHRIVRHSGADSGAHTSADSGAHTRADAGTNPGTHTSADSGADSGTYSGTHTSADSGTYSGTYSGAHTSAYSYADARAYSYADANANVRRLPAIPAGCRVAKTRVRHSGFQYRRTVC